MIDFPWFGLTGFVLSSIFAFALHCLRHWWEPHWKITVLGIVAIGVAYTGGLMYLFTRYGVQPESFPSYRAAQQWMNWYWVYQFLWDAAPMAIWRVGAYITDMRAGRSAVNAFNKFLDSFVASQDGE